MQKKAKSIDITILEYIYIFIRKVKVQLAESKGLENLQNLYGDHQ